jgi:hypothetical protein
MQLEHERPGSHVLDSSAVRAPVPGLGQFLGNAVTMPERVLGDQLADLVKILLGDEAALEAERLLHGMKLA